MGCSRAFTILSVRKGKYFFIIIFNKDKMRGKNINKETRRGEVSYLRFLREKMFWEAQ